MGADSSKLTSYDSNQLVKYSDISKKQSSYSYLLSINVHDQLSRTNQYGYRLDYSSSSMSDYGVRVELTVKPGQILTISHLAEECEVDVVGMIPTELKGISDDFRGYTTNQFINMRYTSRDNIKAGWVTHGDDSTNDDKFTLRIVYQLNS